jgi:hypothetical protein
VSSRPVLGPFIQHRPFDSLGSGFVSEIVFDIDGGCRSIFLTDSMNAGRIVFENLAAEEQNPGPNQ